MDKLYYHGGAANHGCEAIVRSTVKIMEEPLELWSTCPDEDIRYGLDQTVSVREDTYIPAKKRSIAHLKGALHRKLRGDDYSFIVDGHKDFFSQVHKGDICFSIGGDNYCYSGTDRLGYYNKKLHRIGAKTVLWGCSVEPDNLVGDVVDDLKRYDLITVRESLSYEGLKKAGVTENVVLVSDPAFQLDRVECSLPAPCRPGNTVGVNVSPLATDAGSMVMENYEALVSYILEHTDMDVLLLPHVVKNGNDDRDTLRVLLDRFSKSGRVAMAEDHNCMELKGMISQCRFFVGARTHATIAAYSTCVPTLVAGYSVKARGIAKDIFGTDENYVVPVQSFQTRDTLTNAFCWLMEREKQIAEHLKKTMPIYCANALPAADVVRKLK